MKTTEVFVEQVLIGSMVLGIAALPMISEISAFVASSRSFNLEIPGLGIAAVLLGIAYFLGVVFDRLSDTILEIWEKHQRLRFALKDFETFPARNCDPFDESALRTKVLKKGGNIADWMNYLRTRIRLSRSLAIFLPGLTCAVQIGLVRTYCLYRPGKPSSSPAWCGPGMVDTESVLVSALLSPWTGILLLGVYIVLPFLDVILRVLAPIFDWALAKIGIETYFGGVWNPPKTYKYAGLQRYAEVRGLAGEGQPDKNRPHARFLIRLAWFRKLLTRMLDTISAPFFGFLVFALIAIIIAVVNRSVFLAWIAAGGIIVTALSIWAWSRLLDTFNVYLREIGGALDEGEGSV